MRIEKRLKKAFNIVTVISAVASLVGLIAILVVTSNFKNAMANYALPQGDIALFMNEYAECRSNLRGIIGYDKQENVKYAFGETNRMQEMKNRMFAAHDLWYNRPKRTEVCARWTGWKQSVPGIRCADIRTEKLRAGRSARCEKKWNAAAARAVSASAWYWKMTRRFAAFWRHTVCSEACGIIL